MRWQNDVWHGQYVAFDSKRLTAPSSRRGCRFTTAIKRVHHMRPPVDVDLRSSPARRCCSRRCTWRSNSSRIAGFAWSNPRARTCRRSTPNRSEPSIRRIAQNRRGLRVLRVLIRRSQTVVGHALSVFLRLMVFLQYSSVPVGSIISPTALPAYPPPMAPATAPTTPPITVPTPGTIDPSAAPAAPAAAAPTPVATGCDPGAFVIGSGFVSRPAFARSFSVIVFPRLERAAFRIGRLCGDRSGNLSHCRSPLDSTHTPFQLIKFFRRGKRQGPGFATPSAELSRGHEDSTFICNLYGASETLEEMKLKKNSNKTSKIVAPSPQRR